MSETLATLGLQAIYVTFGGNALAPRVEPQTIKCPSERSPMCTREYAPVCATRDTGVRCLTTPCPSSEEKTYSNGCTACADVKVLHYRAGACEPGPENNK